MNHLSRMARSTAARCGIGYRISEALIRCPMDRATNRFPEASYRFPMDQGQTNRRPTIHPMSRHRMRCCRRMIRLPTDRRRRKNRHRRPSHRRANRATHRFPTFPWTSARPVFTLNAKKTPTVESVYPLPRSGRQLPHPGVGRVRPQWPRVVQIP